MLFFFFFFVFVLFCFFVDVVVVVVFKSLLCTVYSVLCNSLSFCTYVTYKPEFKSKSISIPVSEVILL